jgi:zinc transport system substrate-binding protein
MQKKTYLILAVCILILILVGALFGLFSSNAPQSSSSTLKVISTFYPIYDFAQNVGGDKINASILVPATEDVHSFEPTPSSILQVEKANVLIYNGAGLEPWISQVVSAANNPKLLLVNCSEGIPLLQVPPQFQRNGRTVDPHIWLDPVLAKQEVNNILQGLIKADPADQQYFTKNAQLYEAKLDYLNSEMVNITSNAKTHYFVTFHEAFAYFANQYGLIQIPIAGPFEEEPTPSDIQNVINSIHQYHLCYVGYESLENPAISQSIAAQTNAKLVLMDPIEGLTQSDQSAGKTYITMMQDNIQTFSMVLYNVGCS